MLYAGLDLSRKRLDFHLLNSEGATVEVGAAPPDADGLLGLSERLDRHREPIREAILSASAGVRPYDAVGECKHHELGTRFELELAHDVRAMRVDRTDGDEQLLADLLIRVAKG